MQVAVTFRHMEPTEALKQFATEKVERIQKYVHAPTGANVVLSVERYMHKADITISAHGMQMRGEEKSEDMYASIDRAMHKIERQVKRYRNKLTSHKQREGAKAKIRLNILEAERLGAAAEDEGEAPDSGGLPAEVIESKEVHAKLMSVDEAVMQMDLLHNDFFVFLNADTEALNVIYRRKDGKLGLIEALQD